MFPPRHMHNAPKRESSFSVALRQLASNMAALLVLVVVVAPIARAQDAGPTNAAAITDTDFFTTAGRCAMCHSSAPEATALRDAKGRSVAPSDLWPTSMMANSTTDPLWRAVLAAEVAATPSRKPDIEAKCLRCHAPMASVEAEIGGITPTRELLLRGDSTLAKLAADGVSCTSCHQIPPEDLGEDKTFSGHFQIGREGKIFGPHARPFAMPMYRHTGYVPTESAHVRKSALCASCHTLFTDALNPDGTATGHMLLEQGPYVEWQNSAFNDELEAPGELSASCQDCHVPTTDRGGNPIKTRIARNPHGFDFPPVRPREPFGRHSFVGANTLMLSILRDELREDGQETRATSFHSAIEETRHMLREKTARIKITKAERRGDQIAIEVVVTNLAGHKLPTAYPSRRVWIRLRVLNGSGQTLFASGDFDDRGRIVDGEGNVLRSERAGGRIATHHSKIKSQGSVQIYEAVMEDAQGEPTFSLLRGARYHKDNRLLPIGWKSEHERGPTTAPMGTADDADFTAGEDKVVYLVANPPRGPLQIETTLYYQTLGSRYAEELFEHDVPEMRHFRNLHDAADPRPELLARHVQTIE